MGLAAGCALGGREASQEAGFEVASAPQPGGPERYCAWYGDAREGLLYFGESAFWSAERAHGDPLADRHVPGPRRIGRFDLASRRLLAPLDAGPGEAPTGVWDVLAHPNGRVYFTTWFDSMGWVDPQTGEVRRLETLGAGLNEIAPGPEGTLLITRYGSPASEARSEPQASGDEHRQPIPRNVPRPARSEPQASGDQHRQPIPRNVPGPARSEPQASGDQHRQPIPRSVPRGGSVVLVSLDGERLAEHALVAPHGYRVAPKTVAFDPARDEIWVTTDLFPVAGGPIRHDAYLLDRSGREKRRTRSPELQFAAFGPDGTGLLAEVSGPHLQLRVRVPGDRERVLLADGAFPEGLDFVQDIHFARDGRAVVTRWSGVLHLFAPPDSLDTLRLPALEPGGLYYSGVLAGDRVCATHCGGIAVACAPLHRPGSPG